MSITNCRWIADPRVSIIGTFFVPRHTPLYLVLVLVAAIALWTAATGQRASSGMSTSWNWVYLAGAVDRPGFYKVRTGASIGEILKSASDKACSPLVAPCWFDRLGPNTSQVWTFRARQGDRPEAITVSRLPERLSYLLGSRMDINRAGVQELAMLQGIGETMAKRIVLTREEKGPFRTPESLVSVKGIGPKRLGRLRGRILVDTQDPSLQEIVCE